MRAIELNRLAMPQPACESCAVRHRSVCALCEPDELAQLEAVKVHRRFSPGQTIAWAGDDMDFVGSVVEGIASLTQTLEDGRRHMIGLLFPSDFLGRPGRTSLSYDVTALTEVTLCCFRRKPFEELLRRLPRIGHRLLDMTLDELDSAREWTLVLGRKTAREKITSLLAIIARRSAALRRHVPADGMRFELPMSREAMAEYLGLTLETVSRQMTALRKDGVIEMSGTRGVRIPDFSRLLEQTGDDTDGGIPD